MKYAMVGRNVTMDVTKGSRCRARQGKASQQEKKRSDDNEGVDERINRRAGRRRGKYEGRSDRSLGASLAQRPGWENGSFRGQHRVTATIRNASTHALVHGSK